MWPRAAAARSQKIGARIACSFFVLADALSFANDPSLVGAYDLVTDMSSCAVKAVKKPRRPTRKPSPSPGCSISGFSSFEAGTPIETALGRRPIEEIAIGDLVAARDGFTGEVGWRPVRELFRRTAPSIVHLTLDGPDGRRETLNVTSEHPFFVAGKGWTEVRRLERGDPASSPSAKRRSRWPMSHWKSSRRWSIISRSRRTIIISSATKARKRIMRQQMVLEQRVEQHEHTQFCKGVGSKRNLAENERGLVTSYETHPEWIAVITLRTEALMTAGHV